MQYWGMTLSCKIMPRVLCKEKLLTRCSETTDCSNFTVKGHAEFSKVVNVMYFNLSLKVEKNVTFSLVSILILIPCC